MPGLRLTHDGRAARPQHVEVARRLVACHSRAGLARPGAQVHQGRPAGSSPSLVELQGGERRRSAGEFGHAESPDAVGRPCHAHLQENRAVHRTIDGVRRCLQHRSRAETELGNGGRREPLAKPLAVLGTSRRSTKDARSQAPSDRGQARRIRAGGGRGGHHRDPEPWGSSRDSASPRDRSCELRADAAGCIKHHARQPHAGPKTGSGGGRRDPALEHRDGRPDAGVSEPHVEPARELGEPRGCSLRVPAASVCGSDDGLEAAASPASAATARWRRRQSPEAEGSARASGRWGDCQNAASAKERRTPSRSRRAASTGHAPAPRALAFAAALGAAAAAAAGPV